MYGAHGEYADDDDDASDSRLAPTNAGSSMRGISGSLIKSPPIRDAESGSIKAWKRRFFVLREDSCMVHYFKDEASCNAGGIPKGSIDLTQNAQVALMPGSKRYSHMFSITTRDRVFYLSAPGLDEQQQWVRVVGVAIAEIRKHGMRKDDPSLVTSAPQNSASPAAATAASPPPAATAAAPRVVQMGPVAAVPHHAPAPRQAPPPSSGGDSQEAYGLVTHLYPKEFPRDHLVQPWFYGKMGREQAEQELHEAAGPTGSGVFLVRESERVPGSFALSWCQSGRISHTQILYRHNKFMFNVPTGAPKPESTLTALIESPAFREMLQRADAQARAKASKAEGKRKEAQHRHLPGASKPTLSSYRPPESVPAAGAGSGSGGSSGRSGGGSSRAPSGPSRAPSGQASAGHSGSRRSPPKANGPPPDRPLPVPSSSSSYKPPEAIPVSYHKPFMRVGSRRPAAKAVPGWSPDGEAVEEKLNAIMYSQVNKGSGGAEADEGGYGGYDGGGVPAIPNRSYEKSSVAPHVDGAAPPQDYSYHKPSGRPAQPQDDVPEVYEYNSLRQETRVSAAQPAVQEDYVFNQPRSQPSRPAQPESYEFNTLLPRQDSAPPPVIRRKPQSYEFHTPLHLDSAAAKEELILDDFDEELAAQDLPPAATYGTPTRIDESRGPPVRPPKQWQSYESVEANW